MTSTAITVAIKRLAHGGDLPLPSYATKDAAGMDLSAAVQADLVLKPGKRAIVPTGISIALPSGYEAQVRPRSGLAAKNAVTVLNAPGTIDADYRGEVQVLLVNHGEAPFELRRGERIAQLLIAPVASWTWVPEPTVEALGGTERGEGGYGSTGR